MSAGRVAEPGALVDVHMPRTLVELRERIRRELARLLPGVPHAVLLGEDHGEATVLLAAAGCPLAEGAKAGGDAWRAPGVQRLPIPYRQLVVAELQCTGAGAGALAELSAILPHFGVALANLRLNDFMLAAADQNTKVLVALQHGITLFQEQDPDVVGARFLDLALSLSGAQAGGLFLLQDFGDLGSPLVLVQSIAAPADLFATLRTPDGEPWPQSAILRPAALVRRSARGFEGLRAEGLPYDLASIAAVPLRIEQTTVGLALLLNADGGEGSAMLLESLRCLSGLGAVLFQRLRLEASAIAARALQTEIDIAGEIQKRLLPSEPPGHPRLRCAWRSTPARRIGGDYVDLATGEGGDLFTVVADVSGHGINSALLMGATRSTWRARATASEPHCLLAMLNREIQSEVGGTGMFITAAACRIDAHARRLHYASAGHHPMLLQRARDGSIEALMASGPPLGFLAGADYGLRTVPLAAGDTLLSFTDGLVEACRTEDGEMFGEERLRQCFAAGAGLAPAAFLERLDAELHAFLGGSRPDDDVTVCVVQVT